MRVSERGRESFRESKQTCIPPCLSSSLALGHVLDEFGLLALAPRVVSLHKDHALSDGRVVPGPKLGQRADIWVIERALAKNLKCFRGGKRSIRHQSVDNLQPILVSLVLIVARHGIESWGGQEREH